MSVNLGEPDGGITLSGMRPWHWFLIGLGLCALLFFVPLCLIELRLDRNGRQRDILVQELKRECPSADVREAGVSYEVPRLYLRIFNCEDTAMQTVVADTVRRIKRDRDLGVEIWVIFGKSSDFGDKGTIKIR